MQPSVFVPLGSERAFGFESILRAADMHHGKLYRKKCADGDTIWGKFSRAPNSDWHLFDIAVAPEHREVAA